MSELMWYVSISLISLLLFYCWFRRQGHSAEKRWLLQQIADSEGTDQQQYAQVLATTQPNQASGRLTLLVALLILPAAFVIDYVWFHEIPIEERVSAQESNEDIPDLATAIQQLEQKLIENPDDLEGQLLYARAMMSTQQYTYAVAAYQKASSLDPNNAMILTDLAEAIAFENNTGSFLGEPESYLIQALEADPKHQKAMWLQGIVFYEKQQYQEAENLWTALLTQIDNPNISATITKQINQARAALNKEPIGELTQPPANRVNYFVVINASEAIQALNLSEQTRLFVFAKEVGGPPMPIAAVPLEAPFAWPMSVSLNDQHSLNPNRPLSSFVEVELSAKLSLSGNATTAADDINSNSQVAQQGSNSIQLTLDL